jgi:hypothetical protein
MGKRRLPELSPPYSLANAPAFAVGVGKPHGAGIAIDRDGCRVALIAADGETPSLFFEPVMIPLDEFAAFVDALLVADAE